MLHAGWNYRRGFASDGQRVRELVEKLGGREVLDFLKTCYADTVIDVAESNSGRLDLVRSTFPTNKPWVAGLLATQLEFDSRPGTSLRPMGYGGQATLRRSGIQPP